MMTMMMMMMYVTMKANVAPGKNMVQCYTRCGDRTLVYEACQQMATVLT